MKLFRSYLKKQAGTLIMLALFAGLLLAILRLYGAPLEGALYGLLLCLGLGLGFLRLVGGQLLPGPRLGGGLGRGLGEHHARKHPPG